MDFGFVQVMESLSIALIVISFLLFLLLNTRLKTVKSFQFEALIFCLILMVSEIPHLVQLLGLMSLTGYESLGQDVHTTAMVTLSVFVAIRVYRYISR